MKRHAFSLLERKRAEFAGPGNSGQRPHVASDRTLAAEVKMSDGYDWLRVITRTERTVKPVQ